MSKDPGYSDSKTDTLGARVRTLEMQHKGYQIQIEIMLESHKKHVERLVRELNDSNREIKRLDRFCREFVYGEENPKYYKTMDEKLDIAVDVIKWLRMQVDNPREFNTVMTDKIDEALKKIEGIE